MANNGIIGQTAAAANSAVTAIDGLSKSVNNFSNIINAGSGFTTLVNEIEASNKAVSNLSTAITNDFITNALGIGIVGDSLGVISSLFTGLGSVVTFVGKGFQTFLESSDALSSGIRKLHSDNFALATGFGGTYSEAVKLSEYLVSRRSDLATIELGSFDADKVNQGMRSILDGGISFERLSDPIITSAGAMDLLTVATIQAEASGMSASSYYAALTSGMLRQGLSAQEAAEQIADFGEISRQTGLSVSTISSSLGGLSENLSKIGITADFGRPFLVGFANTLDDMGLAISNATNLTDGLATALAKVGENYGNAYILAQRGNLGFGQGSGVLGAGIQMQAAMLESQAPGNEDKQRELGYQLAEGLRDTLSSFAGGQIVTVSEAAENPALQTAFYTQSKLLSDMYGLDSSSAARTLELLSNLNEAMSTGDVNTADLLADQLNESINTRDKTVDLLDKLNASATALVSETMLQTSAYLLGPREFVNQNILPDVMDAFGEFRNQATELMKDGNPQDGFDSLFANMTEKFNSVFNQENASAMRDRHEEIMADPGKELSELISSIHSLVETVRGYATPDRIPSSPASLGNR